MSHDNSGVFFIFIVIGRRVNVRGICIAFEFVVDGVNINFAFDVFDYRAFVDETKRIIIKTFAELDFTQIFSDVKLNFIADFRRVNFRCNSH